MNADHGQKILWLASWYPNRRDRTDGDFIQRHARAVARFCMVHVISVLKNDDTAVPVEEEMKVEGNLTEQIIYYTSPKTGIRLLDRFLSQRIYRECCRKAIAAYIEKNGKPGCVHVHVAMKAGLAALWIKNKWDIPFVITEHWTGYYRQAVPSIFNFNWLFRYLNKKILKEARYFLPVSKDLGETVKREFAAIPYHVIPNTVDTDLFYFKPWQPVKFRFIHVSYMNHQKNPEDIIKASALLMQKGYDFEVLMLGNKPQKLLDLAIESGLHDKVLIFKEAVPYAEVARHMQDSSAFILFSWFENLPCVILEAFCCGLPVISSQVGGIAEVVEDKNGILVESGQPEQLAIAMQKLIDNYSSYNRKVIAGEAASKFNYDIVGNQFLEVYNKIKG
ncbi:MAG TPA: glycosyltransferase [Ferruginibacter sp.]|nr:glycosyltransferase [Ferruginibacter sp.]